MGVFGNLHRDFVEYHTPKPRPRRKRPEVDIRKRESVLIFVFALVAQGLIYAAGITLTVIYGPMWWVVGGLVLGTLAGWRVIKYGQWHDKKYGVPDW